MFLNDLKQSVETVSVGLDSKGTKTPRCIVFGPNDIERE